ncbi:hypothetical protein BC826DRAFT_965758 [Russula brevipes]|nr:hypothetical protein BC826DRAFT_965758 [Russula brevipes]
MLLSDSKTPTGSCRYYIDDDTGTPAEKKSTGVYHEATQFVALPNLEQGTQYRQESPVSGTGTGSNSGASFRDQLKCGAGIELGRSTDCLKGTVTGEEITSGTSRLWKGLRAPQERDAIQISETRDACESSLKWETLGGKAVIKGISRLVIANRVRERRTFVSWMWGELRKQANNGRRQAAEGRKDKWDRVK